MSCSGRAPQLTATNGPAPRGGKLVNGPGEHLLARARLAQKQHRGLALGDLGQHAHHLGQAGIAGAEVVQGLQPLLAADEPPAGQVAHHLHPADDRALGVADRGRAHAHRHVRTALPPDRDNAVGNGVPLVHGLTQHADGPAVAHAEDLETGPTHGRLGRAARDLGRGRIEGADHEVPIHGEHGIGHAAQHKGVGLGIGELVQGMRHGPSVRRPGRRVNSDGREMRPFHFPHPAFLP